MSDIVSKAKNGYLQDVLNLLKDGHSVDTRDKDNYSALYWSACRGYPDICKVLIHYNSNVNLKYRCGFTALHAASDRGQVDCVKVLLDANADVNIQNDRGETPLHLACYRGFVDIVKLLIQARINPFIKNSSNKIALQEAYSQEYIDVTKLLEQYQSEVENIYQISQSVIKVNTSRPDSYLLTPKNFVRPTNSPKLDLNIPVNPPVNNFTKYSLHNSSFSDSTSFFDSSDHSDLSSGALRSQVNYSSGSAVHSNDFSSYPSTGPRAMVTSNSDCTAYNLRSREPVETEIHSPEVMEGDKLSYDTIQSFAEALQIQLAKIQEENSKLEKINKNLSDRCQQLATTNSNLGEDLKRKDQKLLEEREMRQQIVRRSHQHQLELERRFAEAELHSINSVQTNGTMSRELKLCHRNILDLLKQKNSSMSCFDWKNLCDKVSLLWKHSDNMDTIDTPNHEWILAQDYTIIGEHPVNHFGDGQRDGSNSLVFRIQHKSKFYMLKMMINLINLHYFQHNQGHSIDEYLMNNFGPEYLIPLFLSKHPNIIPVLHYYQGSTQSFKKYQHLLVPRDFDVPIEMANRTTFLVLPEYSMTLKTFMMEHKDQSRTPLYGLPEQFLLQFFYQLLSSIVFLKMHKVVHRDIKADNIFLDNHLRPVLGDFGLARSLYDPNNKPVRFTNKSEVAAGNSHAWAPEICRYSRYDPLLLPQTVLLEDIYCKSDGYAVSRMFYSILQPPNSNDTFPTSSINVPNYQNSEIPELPETLSAEFRSILKDLVLNDPLDRPTVNQAMLRVGGMLFSPSQDEVTSLQEMKQYHEARLLTLGSIDSKQWHQTTSKKVLSVEESIKMNSLEIEANFLTTITSEELWEIHKSRIVTGLKRI